MAVPQNSVTPTTRLTVSSLLSPPELCSESFSSSLSPSQNIACTTKSTMDSGAKVFGPMNQYASPPFSPDYSLDHKENVAPSSSQQTQGSQHDFALFPADDRRASATSIASDQPLFPSQESESMAREVIEKHMKSSEYARLPVKPSRDEYAVVAAGFQTTWLDQALKNPKAWRAQEREYERQYSEGRYGGRPTGIQKHRSQVPKKLAPAPSSRSRQPKVALPRLPPRSPRAPRAKRSPKARVSNSFSQSPTGASPRPARPVQRDDTNWQILPDYSPPIETLSKGNKILKAEWKGGPLDISNDPNRHLLHEYEFNVAATLRLTCATYLTSKRRVFMGRVEALRKGKEFRKTDAQQACKIDVNKASKLWSAFDRIGWFNPEYFRAYV